MIVHLSRLYTWQRGKRKTFNKVYYEPDGYEDDNEVYEEDDDEGQNYVVRKLMLIPKQEEITQRHQLFWIRCTISGKLF